MADRDPNEGIPAVHGGEDVNDPIIKAPDDGMILPDGDPLAVRCPECGHCFSRDDAAARTFDGDTARWQCPRCGRWRTGVPPSP